MRPALIFTAFIALSCFAECSPARAECLPSAKAVWATHPGSHATWRMRNDAKCWFVGYPAHRHVRVVDSRRGMVHGQADPLTDGQAKQASPARLESQDTSAATRSGPPSILMWGAPMRIDDSWEEMFMRRERRAE
jgi:hypothetical protein